MKKSVTSATLLGAVTALGLGIAPVFAANGSTPNASGYAYPDFWGDAPAQQAPSAPAANRADGATIGTYVTHSTRGTWLFPPDANQGGNS